MELHLSAHPPSPPQFSQSVRQLYSFCCVSRDKRKHSRQMNHGGRVEEAASFKRLYVLVFLKQTACLHLRFLHTGSEFAIWLILKPMRLLTPTVNVRGAKKQHFFFSRSFVQFFSGWNANTGPLTSQSDVRCSKTSHKKNSNVLFLCKGGPADEAGPSNSSTDMLKYWWSFTRFYLSFWIVVLNLHRLFIYSFI